MNLCSGQAPTTVTSMRCIEVRIPTRLASAEIASPMDEYPQHRHRRSSWYGIMSTVIVEITTADGVHGIGATHGGAAVRAIVDGHLAPLLIGQDICDLAATTERLRRATLPYGGVGLAAMAVSACDLAFWDAAGKRAETPVWQLLPRVLGGQSSLAACPSIRAYANGARLADYCAAGFDAVKVSLVAGPWDPDGQQINAETLRRARAQVGDDILLMADAWMGWNPAFLCHMAPHLQDHRVYWMEEPLPPSTPAVWGAGRLAIAPVRLATGEHCWSESEADALLHTDAVDVFQPDVQWCGGLSAAWRMWDTADRHGVTVVPHLSGQVWGLSLVAARPTASMVEWYDEPQSDDVGTLFYGCPQPHDGRLRPSGEPGFGITLNTSVVERWAA